MKPILGIDPGKSGGIALIDTYGVRVESMPSNPNETYKLIQDFDLWKHSCNPVCYLEQVSGFAGSNQPGSRMFEFGRSFGQLEGILAAVEIPVVLVRPQKWQKALGCGTRGNRTASQWKNHLKAMAARLFPDIKVTLKISDALLIAHYGRQTHR